MIFGYAQISTDGQSVSAQVQQLTEAGCTKVFREVASGAKTDRVQLRRALAKLESGDVRRTDGDTARPLGTFDPGSSGRVGDRDGSASWLSLIERRLGRYHDPHGRLMPRADARPSRQELAGRRRSSPNRPECRGCYVASNKPNLIETDVPRFMLQAASV